MDQQEKIEKIITIAQRGYDTWEDFRDAVGVQIQPPTGVHGDKEVMRFVETATRMTYGFSFNMADVAQAERVRAHRAKVARQKAQRHVG